MIPPNEIEMLSVVGGVGGDMYCCSGLSNSSHANDLSMADVSYRGTSVYSHCLARMKQVLRQDQHEMAMGVCVLCGVILLCVGIALCSISPVTGICLVVLGVLLMVIGLASLYSLMRRCYQEEIWARVHVIDGHMAKQQNRFNPRTTQENSKMPEECIDHLMVLRGRLLQAL